MKVLVVGSGGREHALIWKIAQSLKVDKIYCAPGNAGISSLAECIDIKDDDIDSLLAFAIENSIDLTVVGPELPLVMGIVDKFESHGLKVFGPNKKCAMFEGSKAFTKEFLYKHNIPTAKYKEYTDLNSALKDIGIFGFPMVIKADGLAAGKGVVIATNAKEAKEALEEMIRNKKFGQAGSKVVIEEFLVGREASVLCFVDGNTIIPMESAQDYKRALDEDKGLNTGGMGTYSPNILFNSELNKKVNSTILQPIIEGFNKDGMNFKGVLFIGLMIDKGQPKVLEFNVRFGDPETQVVMMRLETDIIEIMESVIEGRLDDQQIKWSNKSSVCVVLASQGYPEAYEKGKVISGLNDVKDVIVFHAGTRFEGKEIVTNGGRVLGVTALGDSIEEARQKVYKNVDQIHFEGKQFRSDIALINN